MKRALLLLVILIVPVFLFAQESDVFRLGFKFGPNFSFGSGTPTNPDIYGTKLTAGFSAGGFAELVPIDNLSVEFDIFFTWFNYGVKSSSTQDITLKYAAMELPLIVKGRLPLGPGVAFLGIGPDFIFLAGNYYLKIGSTDFKLPADQIFHTMLIVTGGYDWAIAQHANISLELRYLRSFSSPSDSADINANRFDVLFGWSADF